MKKKKLIALTVPALIIILIDQVTKHWVRTTPSLQNWDIIPGWLAFHYTQNPGMALGMDWASTPIISAIAILATIAIIAYIVHSLDRANIGYLLCMGLVLGGAFGNIIDRLVMGYIESYGGLLEGHVIDFIHFTLRIEGYPVFPYIFNVADISISTAIISLLLFHQRILPVEDMNREDAEEVEPLNPEDFKSPSTGGGLSSSEEGTEVNPLNPNPKEMPSSGQELNEDAEDNAEPESLNEDDEERQDESFNSDGKKSIDL